jgi:5'-nucleotidase
MRIMVTNDDGIDSVGLHVLARSMDQFGEVFVVAPDSEYSGASAAVGALHLLRPEVHVAHIDRFAGQVFTVSGPPALCTLFTRLGAFGPLPDLVVSGINPGANVGRAVYHSGTVGAAVTARSGGITGVAVSQSVPGDVDGQGDDDELGAQLWDSAAEVAALVVGHLIDQPPAQPGVLNVNVPNLPFDQLGPWRWTEVGRVPPRTMSRATLVPRPGHEGTFHVLTEYGEPQLLPEHEDGGAVERGMVSLSWLTRFDRDPSLEWDLGGGA